MSSIEVAKLNEIPEGGMKRVVVNNTAILLSNIAGEIYATSDRCGHQNASLARGTLNESTVTCALHGATFDVRTGKNLSGPKLGMPPEVAQKLPQEMLTMFRKTAEIISEVQVYSLETFPVELKDGSIFISQRTAPENPLP